MGTQNFFSLSYARDKTKNIFLNLPDYYLRITVNLLFTRLTFRRLLFHEQFPRNIQQQKLLCRQSYISARQLNKKEN